MDILPLDIWPIIIAHIDDFKTWQRVHLISHAWLRWVLALDAKKLYEFTKSYEIDRSLIVKLSKNLIKDKETVNTSTHLIKCPRLPNSIIHGSLLHYDKNGILWANSQFYLGKRYGITMALYHATVYRYINNIEIQVNKELIYYINNINMFTIFLDTSKNNYAVYFPRYELIFHCDNGIKMHINPKN